MLNKSELAFLKEERRIMTENKNEALADFKNAVPISDHEYDRMTYVRGQLKTAERERYAAYGRMKAAKSELILAKSRLNEAEDKRAAVSDVKNAQTAYTEAKAAFDIAEQVCDDQRERFETQNAIFRTAFERKQYCWEVYCYFRDEHKRIDKIISDHYRELWKRPKSKNTNTPKDEKAGG